MERILNFDFHEKFADETSRKNKYKFERWLQQDVEFISDYAKKTKPRSYYESVAQDAGFEILGTHAKSQGSVIPAGHNAYFCSCKTCGVVRRVSFGYLQEKNANCFVCFINRLVEEAKSNNLELIGPSLDGDAKRRHYLFPCGHSRDIATGDVRVGQFSCTACYAENLEDSFKFLNIENLGRPDDSYGVDTTQYYRIRHKDCSHERLALQGQIVARVIGECTECYEQNLKNRVESAYDIKILSKEFGTKRKIKFNQCQHEKVVTLSNLKRGIFSCAICQTQKFKEEAEQVGLEYLGPSESVKDKKQAHKYLAECGHTIISKTGHIRTGHWTCRECNSGYLDQPNKLYLFKIKTKGFEFLKVGYSKKPEHRKYDYKTDKDATFELIRVVAIPTGRQAITVENDLHKKYKRWNYPSKFMKNYIYESGFTECYPLNLLDDFMQDFQTIERWFIND